MRDQEAGELRAVRFRDAIWRLGGSPWSFYFLGALLAVWILIGSAVPQVPMSELQGMASVEIRQLTRLFEANELAFSWFTYLLLTLLFINGLGMAFAKRLGPASFLLPIAFVLGVVGFYASTHVVQRGTVWVREGGNNIHTDFRAIAETNSGRLDITLPFSLMCPPQDGDSLNCIVQHAKNGKRQSIVIHTPGNGVSTIGSYRMSWTQTRPAQRPTSEAFDIKPPAPWVYLGSNGESGVVCKDEPCPRPGKSDAPVDSLTLGPWKLSFLSTKNDGAVLVANGPGTSSGKTRVLVGLDSRLREGPDAPVAKGDATTHLPGSVRAPRWLGMSFVRIPENSLLSTLYWAHPLFVLAAVGLLISLLRRKDEEKV
ncbi:MAG: hypothetical protein CMH54_05865 [Myxococcales bacterium]|nr:hypothetical protein [Myxococcales bacterium]